LIEIPLDDEIKLILENAQTIAVVGLSDDPNRTSYQVSKAMKEAGYTIIPVNPNIKESLGGKAYPSLIDVKEKIDIINVFRRSAFLPELAKEAAKTNGKVFWAQQGVTSEEAYKYLVNRNFTVVMDRCIKVAHSVLIGK
jgi:predicted CoA-binding protein